MPYELQLSKGLKRAGWKVKIRDAERLEEPHVTMVRNLRSWRLSLRTGEFLDRGDKWSDIDVDVRETIHQNWDGLQQEWDLKYPHNPIARIDDE